ncbi:nstp-8 [Pristionchus pacificus]|uniref:Nstp-8 n=1 Tax=Pristionchus pacificus TaxID=54126 RepID=A0A454XMC4_PRIPA|nr:nstp-8 [Pristionchus pacificus]|eukprot:PDM75304.1 nstp-8 [Pristionchus pacificus]
MREEGWIEDTRPLVPPVEIQREKISFMKSLWLKVSSAEFISLVVLTIHMSTLPLLVRQASKEFIQISPTVSSHPPLKFLASTSVLMSEFFKLFICTSLIAAVLDQPKQVFHKVYTTIVHNRRETAKICVPALIYAIQNNLYYVALANLDATTFSVTSQLRILTTALLAVFILNKILSCTQWVALFISLLGVVIVQIEKARTSSNPNLVQSGNPVIGFSATFAIAWMSSFAGVYFEKVLKESKTDVWIQNIRLALLTIPFSFITMMVTDGKKIIENGFFQGWSPLLLLVTILTALGGILVSLVMKYACNVRKTYCQTLAIAITVIMSMYTGDVHPSIALVIGVILTISSVFIYALYPAHPKVGDMDRKILKIDLEKELDNEDEEEDEEDKVEGRRIE